MSVRSSPRAWHLCHCPPLGGILEMKRENGGQSRAGSHERLRGELRARRAPAHLAEYYPGRCDWRWSRARPFASATTGSPPSVRSSMTLAESPSTATFATASSSRWGWPTPTCCAPSTSPAPGHRLPPAAGGRQGGDRSPVGDGSGLLDLLHSERHGPLPPPPGSPAARMSESAARSCRRPRSR